MNVKLCSLLGVVCLLCASLLTGNAQAQSLYNFQLNTTLTGARGNLAFDLINSDGVDSNNSVTISEFTTDSLLDSSGNTNTTGASGNLPNTLTLADTEFFNESTRGLTVGSSISFNLTLTQNAVAGALPDEFSFFLLDASGQSLIPTSDASGSDALFTIDFDGAPSGALTVYTPLATGTTWNVASGHVNPTPAPSALLVFCLGLIPGLIARRQRGAKRVGN